MLRDNLNNPHMLVEFLHTKAGEEFKKSPFATAARDTFTQNQVEIAFRGAYLAGFNLAITELGKEIPHAPSRL